MNEVRAPLLVDLNMGEKKHNFKTLCSSSSAYLAAVNAACERAPIIYPRALSDGQFYSPPESVAGDLLDLFLDLVFVSVRTSEPQTEGFFSLNVCLQALRRTWTRRASDAGL